MATTPERSERRFGWADAAPTSAHSYLMPTVLATIGRRARQDPQRGALRIVDVGCGNGYVAAQLAARGHDVTAIDPAEDGIRIARTLGSSARFLSASVYDDNLPVLVGADV